MRHAIYICPAQGSDLMALAGRWLGRNAYKDKPRQQPDVPGIAELTKAPRRYGFHGTIVAPFRLNEETSVNALRHALGSFCGKEPTFELPLKIGRIGPYFALVPVAPSPPLHALSDRAVQAFHSFRAEPTEAETAKRRPETLTPGQRAMLARWHYPYVFDEFRFHMTLTGPVPDAEAAKIQTALEIHFGDALGEPFRVDALARYAEAEPGANFTIAERFAFAGDTP